MKKTVAFLTLMLSVMSAKADLALDLSTYCAQTGLKLQVLGEAGFSLQKDGRNFLLSGEFVNIRDLGETEVLSVSSDLSAANVLVNGEQIKQAQAFSLFSAGTLEGLSTFYQVSVESGDNIALLKDRTERVIFMGRIGTCSK